MSLKLYSWCFNHLFISVKKLFKGLATMNNHCNWLNRVCCFAICVSLCVRCFPSMFKYEFALRSSGRSMFHKTSKVEFHPLGVVGAIVSWNYPFHNIFNPMLAAVFSGNSIVIKVRTISEMSTFHIDVSLIFLFILFPSTK